MDDSKDIEAQIIMLQRVTSALWANVLRGQDGNGAARADIVAESSLATIEAIHGNPRAAKTDAMHHMIQLLMHHEEAFWDRVKAQI